MRPALGPVLRILTATALAVDAGVHASSASIYDTPHGGLLTAGNLFRAEAGVASLVALLVLLRPTRRAWLLALGVAASALGAVVLYRYVDVGAIGPVPNLYDPTWQVPGKLLSAYAEGAAVLLAAVGLVAGRFVSADNQPHGPSTLHLGWHRPAHGGLPRHRVGRAGP